MNILYGVCGEGHGHAGRSIAIAEELMLRGHNVKICTFGQGYNLFKINGFKDIHEIMGLHFGTTNGAISTIKTLQKFQDYCFSWDRWESAITHLAKRFKPDLVLSDFEPLVAKAARNLNVPLVTIDNQHRFMTSLPCQLSPMARMYCVAAGWFVRQYIGRAKLNIITAFHDIKCNRSMAKVGAILRRHYEQYQPSDQGHILVYTRPDLYPQVLKAIKPIKRLFHVYGYGSQGQDTDYIKHLPISDQFVKDLASCHAVISCAGLQIITEAKYFGKKILVQPIRGQYEQIVNAELVEPEQLGFYCDIETRNIEVFINHDYGSKPQMQNDLSKVANLIEAQHG